MEQNKSCITINCGCCRKNDGSNSDSSTILWNNGNPTAVFPGQELNADIIGYFSFDIEYASHVPDVGRVLHIKINRNTTDPGVGNMLYTRFPKNSVPLLYVRSVYISNNKISFGPAFAQASNSTTLTEDNSKLVPIVD